MSRMTPMDIAMAVVTESPKVTTASHDFGKRKDTKMGPHAPTRWVAVKPTKITNSPDWKEAQ
eukprot:182519-Ditylum_brightwellii.AAC.2